MPSVSSFLPGSTGQPILGLEYSRGERIKESGGVRLTAYYVKALWKSRGEAKRSSFIFPVCPEIIKKPQAAE